MGKREEKVAAQFVTYVILGFGGAVLCIIGGPGALLSASDGRVDACIAFLLAMLIGAVMFCTMWITDAITHGRSSQEQDASPEVE